MVNGVLYSTAGTPARRRRARCRRPASSSGCTASRKARAARRRRGSCPAAASRTGPTAASERILYVTPGYRLVALEREDRRPGPGFGDDGIVDLKHDDDQVIDPMNGEIGLHATPMVAKNVVIVGAARRDRREPEEPSERERARPRLRRADRQAALDLPHDPAAGRVRQRDVGKGVVGLHGQHGRLGARSRSTKSSASRICRSRCRPATTTAAIVRATACSARASSPSICRPASASGTTSSCTTASGTWTSRARRFSPTSPSTAGRSRPSRSRPSRACCTCSIA